MNIMLLCEQTMEYTTPVPITHSQRQLDIDDAGIMKPFMMKNCTATLKIIRTRSRMIVYTLCIVYELSLGNFASVPFVFAVFSRGYIVNKVQTQQ